MADSDFLSWRTALKYYKIAIIIVIIFGVYLLASQWLKPRKLDFAPIQKPVGKFVKSEKINGVDTIAVGENKNYDRSNLEKDIAEKMKEARNKVMKQSVKLVKPPVDNPMPQQ